MRVGIICEGSTDYAVLKSVIVAVLGKGVTFALLQPDFDGLTRPQGREKPATGWQAVRAFLQTSSLDLFLSPLDMIVVQIDADVRSLPAIAKVLVAEDADIDDLEPLCRHVKSWMAEGVPNSVVIALPRESTETWLVAAHTNNKNVEADQSPAKTLVQARLIGENKEKPLKTTRDYERLCPALAHIVAQAEMKKSPVAELWRFRGKLMDRRRAVLNARSMA